MDHTLPITQRILSPTDLSQFLRLERCERYLRLRMVERENGRRFLYDFDVAAQEMPPLLGRSGDAFEKAIDAQLFVRFPVTDFKAPGKREPDNERLGALIDSLAPAERRLVAQPRLEVPLGRFLIRGEADLILLERTHTGDSHATIIDIKSSTAAKVEHRLQVAFYAQMLAVLNPALTISTAILYKGPAQSEADDTDETRVRDKHALRTVLGIETGYLECIADDAPYRAEVESLVSGRDPVAERIAVKDARELAFSLGLKCDGCLFNEYCMKKAHVDQDLSLLPYLTGREKKALRRAGIPDIPTLAALKTLNDDRTLTPAVDAPPILSALAKTPVGPRIDELILRARRKIGHPTLPYLPHHGHTTLPVSTPEHHPGLVRIVIEVQHDFVQDRAYLLAALVIAHENGAVARRRHIVHTTDSAPERPAQEAQLFADWIARTLAAVAELAAEPEVPIHLIFWNDYGQKALLEALGRNLPAMIDAAPALYDFVTQIAAYDSPVATFLADEIRQHKNYAPVCPSLPLIAAHLRFDWTDPTTGTNYACAFRAHLFDNRGKLDDGTFYARRSRHSSQIPLEYAYAAWGELPAPPDDRDDPFAPYRAATIDDLIGFARRRLDAIEHIAADLPGNDKTYKTPFRIPELATYANRARHLAEAVREFLTIERHTTIAAWRTVRQFAPERRALLGETLLVSYHDADQDDGGAHMQEGRRRHALHEAWKAAHPDKKRRDKAIMDATRWSLDDVPVTLRVETAGTDTDLETLLGLLTLKDGERLVLMPRLTDYGQDAPYTPTPKQILYGARFELLRLNVERDADGIARSATVALKAGHGGGGEPGYVFGSGIAPLADGTLSTLDPDPNDFLGARMKRLADALCALEDAGTPGAHGFYRRLARQDLQTPALWPDAAAQGQRRFLDGLIALHAAGVGHDFETAKRDYIGAHGDDPLLLVQGPPGTGKSFSTGFAVLARLQGALAAGIRQRVGLCCKTHSATDVLLKGVVDAQATLAAWQTAAPELFARFFDPRLLQLPLTRFGREGDPEPPDAPYLCAAGTPAALAKLAPAKAPFGADRFDLVVLDEASQMSLPEALLATQPLTADGRVIVVGDPRQMPPIVQHAWDTETRRTFQRFPAYLSLFDFLRALQPPLIQFAESFRLHKTLAEFLREEIYRHDGIDYHSHRSATLKAVASDNPLVAAALDPDYPLVVVVHDEAESQTRNAFEESLIGPLLRALADHHGLEARHGFGVVVPHRAQRLALRQAYPQLGILDDAGQVTIAAVDTVERYQGDEREVIVISATESDPDFVQASATFLLDPRRLTVALSRAKKKLVLIASRTIFEYVSTDDTGFENAQIWKNLLRRACRERLYEADIDGHEVAIYGRRAPGTTVPPSPASGEMSAATSGCLSKSP